MAFTELDDELPDTIEVFEDVVLVMFIDELVAFPEVVLVVLDTVVFDAVVTVALPEVVLEEVVFPAETVELPEVVVLDETVPLTFEVVFADALVVLLEVVELLVGDVAFEEVVFELVELVEFVEFVEFEDCIALALSSVNLVVFLGVSSISEIVAIDSKAPLKEAVLKAFEEARTKSTNTKEVTFIDYYFHKI